MPAVDVCPPAGATPLFSSARGVPAPPQPYLPVLLRQAVPLLRLNRLPAAIHELLHSTALAAPHPGRAVQQRQKRHGRVICGHLGGDGTGASRKWRGWGTVRAGLRAADISMQELLEEQNAHLGAAAALLAKQTGSLPGCTSPLAVLAYCWSPYTSKVCYK